MLRIPVKINSVNILTSFFYCLRMGVEMMGYTISENHARSLSTDKINGISGWISGIKIIAESYLTEDAQTIIASAEKIAAQAIELEASFSPLADFENRNLILRTDLNEYEKIKNNIPSNAVLHLKIKKSDLNELGELASLGATKERFLNVSELEVSEIDLLLKATSPYGLSLDGGNELSPGLRDFDDLANVLEYLEIQ